MEQAPPVAALPLGLVPPEAWSAGNIGHIGKDHNAAVCLRGETPRMWIAACGGVAPLGNGAHHSLRGRATATLAWRGHQTPWDALKRQNSRDTTLGNL